MFINTKQKFIKMKFWMGILFLCGSTYGAQEGCQANPLNRKGEVAISNPQDNAERQKRPPVENNSLTPSTSSSNPLNSEGKEPINSLPLYKDEAICAIFEALNLPDVLNNAYLPQNHVPEDHLTKDRRDWCAFRATCKMNYTVGNAWLTKKFNKEEYAPWQEITTEDIGILYFYNRDWQELLGLHVNIWNGWAIDNDVARFYNLCSNMETVPFFPSDALPILYPKYLQCKLFLRPSVSELLIRTEVAPDHICKLFIKILEKIELIHKSWANPSLRLLGDYHPDIQKRCWTKLVAFMNQNDPAFSNELVLYQYFRQFQESTFFSEDDHAWIQTQPSPQLKAPFKHILDSDFWKLKKTFSDKINALIDQNVQNEDSKHFEDLAEEQIKFLKKQWAEIQNKDTALTLRLLSEAMTLYVKTEDLGNDPLVDYWFIEQEHKKLKKIGKHLSIEQYRWTAEDLRDCTKDYHMIIQYYQRLFKLLQKTGQQGKPSDYRNAGIVSLKIGNREKALAYMDHYFTFVKAQPKLLIKKTNRYSSEIEKFYIKAQEPEKGANHISESLMALREENNNQAIHLERQEEDSEEEDSDQDTLRHEGNLLFTNTCINLYLEAKNPTKAEKAWELFLAYINKTKKILSIDTVSYYYNRMENYYELYDKLKAAEIWESLLRFLETDEYDAYSRAFFNIASNYHKSGKHEKALIFAQKGLEYERKSGKEYSPWDKRDLHALLIKISKTLGLTEQVQEYKLLKAESNQNIIHSLVEECLRNSNPTKAEEKLNNVLTRLKKTKRIPNVHYIMDAYMAIEKYYLQYNPLKAAEVKENQLKYFISIKQFPGSVEFFNLALRYQQLGDNIKALDIAQEGLDYNKNQGNVPFRYPNGVITSSELEFQRLIYNLTMNLMKDSNKSN